MLCFTLTDVVPDIKPRNILVETPSIRAMFEQAPSELFLPEHLPLDPPNDFYIESTPVSSDEEDLALPTALSVRLADFGTCKYLDQHSLCKTTSTKQTLMWLFYLTSWFDRHLTEWIQPQMLRAPEVILGAEWDFKADIWNLGLVVSCTPVHTPTRFGTSY